MSPPTYPTTRGTERCILPVWVSGAPLTEVLDGVCRHIDGELPGTVSAVLLWNESEMQFRLAAGPGMPKALGEAVDGLTIPAPIPHDIESGRPVDVWDIRTDSVFAPRRDAALTLAPQKFGAPAGYISVQSGAF